MSRFHYEDGYFLSLTPNENNGNFSLFLLKHYIFLILEGGYFLLDM